MFTQRFTSDPEINDGFTTNGIPGDCWRAAIASAVGAESLDDVPHFLALASEGWYDLTKFWFARRGYMLNYVTFPLSDEASQWWEYWKHKVEYVLLSGPSPRGNFYHAVVGDTDFNMVHDPHPSGVGILLVEDFFVWIPDPSLQEG